MKRVPIGQSVMLANEFRQQERQTHSTLQLTEKIALCQNNIEQREIINLPQYP